jgi:hypothetical protein
MFRALFVVILLFSSTALAGTPEPKAVKYENGNVFYEVNDRIVRGDDFCNADDPSRALDPSSKLVGGKSKDYSSTTSADRISDHYWAFGVTDVSICTPNSSQWTHCALTNKYELVIETKSFL